MTSLSLHIFEEGMPYLRVRFADQTELRWSLRTAHVIVEADLGYWRSGDFKQLAVHARNESDWGIVAGYNARLPRLAWVEA
jgi:hypothetical protein